MRQRELMLAIALLVAANAQADDVVSGKNIYAEQRVAEIPAASIRQDPQSGETRFHKIVNRLKAGTSLREELQTYLEDFPEHDLARLWLARSMVRSEEPEQALKTLAPLTNPEQADWQVWFWSATAHIQKGELDIARRELDLALADGSNVPGVWVQLAVVEQVSGNHAGAVQLLEIATSLDKTHAQANLNLAYSYERLDRPHKALRAYQTFVVSQGRDVARLRPTVLRRIAELAELAPG